MQRKREMVVIDDVGAVFWPQDDGNHVMAKKLANLFSWMFAQALSFVIDLAYADRNLRWTQTGD